MENKVMAIIQDYLKRLDLTDMPLGRHELDNGDYVNITEYETSEPDIKVFERHRQYIDGFFIISGEEKILLTKNEGKLIQQYTEEDEAELYTDCGDAVEKILKKGELLIIDTDTLHCPSLTAERPEKVRKAIFKIRKKV